MRTDRIMSAIVLTVLAATGIGACAHINEVLKTPEVAPDYDLTCEATPEDLCLRIAVLAVKDWNSDLNVTFRDQDIHVEVKLVDCAVSGAGRLQSGCPLQSAVGAS